MYMDMYLQSRFIVSEFKLNLHRNDQRHEHIVIIITIFSQSTLKRKQLCTIFLHLFAPLLELHVHEFVLDISNKS